MKIKRVENGLGVIEVLAEINSQDGGARIDRNWLEKRLAQDTVFLAEDKGEGIGFAAVNPDFKYDRFGVELDIISVKKEKQSKGVGRALIAEVEKFVSSQKQKNTVYLFTATKNQKAIRFYSGLGFEVCGMLADRYGPAEHSLIMKKLVNG